jgi:hypothetical protein
MYVAVAAMMVGHGLILGVAYEEPTLGVKLWG